MNDRLYRNGCRMMGILIVVLLTSVVSVWGESGEIYGRIIDVQAGTPVEGAFLHIKSLGRGAISDEDGAFVFGDVPSGSHMVEIHRVGFEPKVLGSVSPGTFLDIKLVRDLIGLPEIVTTASRVGERMESVAENVTVLSEEDLEDVPAHDIGEALAFVPGLTIQRRGGLGSERKATIQGSIHRHVLVLLDGVPLNTLAEGLTDLAQIPSEHVERVEVIKGATSSAWGSSLGGAINIITKSFTSKASISGRIGSWGTGQVQAEAGGALGGVGCFVTMSHARTDGFRPMGDYDGRNAFLKLTSELPKGIEAALSFGYNRADVGGFIIETYGPPFFSNPQEHERRYGILNLSAAPAKTVDLDVRLHAMSQDIKVFTFVPPDALEPRPGHTRLTDEETKGANVQASVLLSPNHRLVCGIDLNFGQFESQGDHRVNETALYVSHNIERGNVTLDLGLRFDDNSAFGSVLSPSVGAVYRMRGGMTIVRGTVSRGFNAPPLSYRFIEAPDRLPNSDIEAERAWVYQLGAEVRTSPYLRSRLTLFRAEISDAIEIAVVDSIEVPTGPESTMKVPRVRPENLAHRRRQGAELEVELATPWGISGSAGAMFCDVRDFADQAPEFFSSEGGHIVHDRARLTYDVALDYAAPVGIRANLRGHSVWWNMPFDWGTIDKRFLWDLKVSSPAYSTGYARWEGFASVYNLFDAHFRTDSRFPLPGRWFEAGVRCTF